MLNNRLQYFSLDEKDVNVLAPGKRPRHTISPALALKDGKPVMAWNTPGGDNQPQAMLQAFLNIVEFGMNPQLAVEQPTVITSNFHASNYPQPVNDRLIMPEVLAREDRRRTAGEGTQAGSDTNAASVLATTGRSRRSEDAGHRSEIRSNVRGGESSQRRLRNGLVILSSAQYPFTRAVW